jgi:hypothetical protein
MAENKNADDEPPKRITVGIDFESGVACCDWRDYSKVKSVA